MTSSKLSNFELEKNSRQDPDTCPKCNAPLSWRPVKEYPVALQIVFGVSFLVFMFLFDKIKHLTEIIWIWSFIQIVMAALLMRGRILARRRVLRCVRCNAHVR